MYLEVIKLLLKAGADVNSVDENGVTILMHASAVGNLDVVKMLIKNGANVNARAKNGLTALEGAQKMLEGVRDRRISKCIEVLKKAGAK
ncbi:ankyrin repeat protein [Orenia marismortui]|uniref:Ankyrin repeat protein n=1 Tax=Orenia marismortui TaxID=46469 RepID=A0A4R8GXX4_9FIRM|nr:ankyrin repeat protein [Orenia marismortui]